MEESRFAQFDTLLGNAAKSVQRLKGMYMDKYQLSAAHTDCLCRLLESADGLTQVELARQESMDKAQVSRVLRTLTERGYVTVEGGGYRKQYRLTDTGRQAAQEIQAIILNINRFVSEDIDPADIAVFYRTLTHITENLRRAAEMSADGGTLPFRKDELI